MDEFMIVYIDNILVYSKIMEEHVRYIEAVLWRLVYNKLFIKVKKIDFS
jgi:hypothetical protein